MSLNSVVQRHNLRRSILLQLRACPDGLTVRDFDFAGFSISDSHVRSVLSELTYKGSLVKLALSKRDSQLRGARFAWRLKVVPS